MSAKGLSPKLHSYHEANRSCIFLHLKLIIHSTFPWGFSDRLTWWQISTKGFLKTVLTLLHKISAISGPEVGVPRTTPRAAGQPPQGYKCLPPAHRLPWLIPDKHLSDVTYTSREQGLNLHLMVRQAGI